MVVRRRIRGKGKLVLFRLLAQIVEYGARLHSRPPGRNVDVQNIAHVFGKIHNDGHIAALAGKRGAAATREHRRPMLPADGQGGQGIVNVSRDDNSNGNLAIVAAIGCVECTAACIETYFARDPPAQMLL